MNVTLEWRTTSPYEFDYEDGWYFIEGNVIIEGPFDTEENAKLWWDYGDTFHEE
jgi:hypothetical protein